MSPEKYLRLAFVVAFALSISIMATAQTPPADTITAKILDGEGNPVSGATVYHAIVNPMSLEVKLSDGVKSNDEGKVVIADSEVWNSDRIDFIAARKDGLAWGVSAVLRTEDVEVKLSKPAALVGHVVDPDGNPVSGVRVWVSRVMPTVVQPQRHDLWVVGNLMAAETGKDGKFKIDDIPEKCPVTLLYDAPEGFGDFKTGELSKGEGKGWLVPTEEPKIQLARAGGISGSLREADGGEVVSAMLIRAETLEPECIYIARTDAEGKFEFESVIPGSYKVAALPTTDFEGIMIPMSDFAEVESGKSTEAELKWKRGTEIFGIVTDAETGAPIKGARVSIRYTIQNPPMTRSSTGVTSEDGSYRLRVLKGECGGTAQASGYDAKVIQTFSVTDKNYQLDIKLSPVKQP